MKNRDLCLINQMSIKKRSLIFLISLSCLASSPILWFYFVYIPIAAAGLDLAAIAVPFIALFMGGTAIPVTIIIYSVVAHFTNYFLKFTQFTLFIFIIPAFFLFIAVASGPVVFLYSMKTTAETINSINPTIKLLENTVANNGETDLSPAIFRFKISVYSSAQKPVKTSLWIGLTPSSNPDDHIGGTQFINITLQPGNNIFDGSFALNSPKNDSELNDGLRLAIEWGGTGQQTVYLPLNPRELEEFKKLNNKFKLSNPPNK